MRKPSSMWIVAELSGLHEHLPIRGALPLHLVDHAREYIEDTYKRPVGSDAALGAGTHPALPDALSHCLAGRKNRQAICAVGCLMPGCAPCFHGSEADPPVSRNDDPQTFAAKGPRRKRVALMTGCAQKALNTDINDATIRLLTRHGCDVVIAEGAMASCGSADPSHGQKAESHATAGKNIEAFHREITGDGLDALVINTSGCGTTVERLWPHVPRHKPGRAGHGRGRHRGRCQRSCPAGVTQP